jgi:transposase
MEQFITYSVGIDVDKESLKACFKSREGNQRSVVKSTRTFSNKAQGFNELQGWIEKNSKSEQASLKVVMEATGVYHEHLAMHLHLAEYVVCIVLGKRAKRYMQSLGQKSKNDKIDAQGLADMGLQQELEVWAPASKSIMGLRSLTRQVEMFQENRTGLLNQLEAAEHMYFSDDLIVENLKALILSMDDKL